MFVARREDVLTAIKPYVSDIMTNLTAEIIPIVLVRLSSNGDISEQCGA